MMEGRRQVLPEDVQAILPAVVGHRLHGNAGAGYADIAWYVRR